MAAAKGKKRKKRGLLVRLKSSESSYFYTAKKTARMISEKIKLNLRKYDPTIRKHVLFTEEKIDKKKK